MAKEKEKTETQAPAFVPKIIKHVTMPTLKLVPGTPAYVKITDPIFDGKPSKKKEGETEEKKPPKILNVINLETGEAMQLVCGTVVVSEILDNYKEDAYVGKCFMIEKGNKVDAGGGRGYFTYKISEIEEPK